MRGLFCVHALSQDMLHKLDINQHKGGWDKVQIGSLLNLLKIEVAELEEAVRNNEPARNIGLEAADVACFAMMVADRSGSYDSHEHFDYRPEGVFLNRTLASKVLAFVNYVAEDNYNGRQQEAKEIRDIIWQEEANS